MYLFFSVAYCFCFLSVSPTQQFRHQNKDCGCGLRRFFRRCFLFVSSRMSFCAVKFFRKIFYLLHRIVWFLFGFPIGCKLTADFYSSKYISREKASALCCFTNNLSPVFVITAIQEILQLPLSPVYVFLIYGIPFLYGMSMLLLYHRTPSSTQKETASRFHMDMQIIDAGIIHGFETLIKICGYIILFSIFCEMLQTLPFPAHWFSLAATGFLEVTNGVALLSTSACTRQIKSLLAVLFLSWGGLSGIFQVSSILHQTGLSLRNYVLQKIILLLLTVGCCIPLLFLGILI